MTIHKFKTAASAVKPGFQKYLPPSDNVTVAKSYVVMTVRHAMIQMRLKGESLNYKVVAMWNF